MKDEKVQYFTQDNIKITAIHTKPDDSSVNIRGAVILAHGIIHDKNEKGLFIEISEALCDSGFEVLRFDFRGHGESELNSEDMTISTQLLDIDASISFFQNYKKIGLLGASFGGGASILYTVRNPLKISTLVLFNPVFNYKRALLEPETERAREYHNFAERKEELERNGYIEVRGKNYRLGKRLAEEALLYKPYEEFAKVQCKVLTIHGFRDSLIPYGMSEEYTKVNNNCTLIGVNLDHGFHESNEEKDKVIQKTVEWFTQNSTA